MNFKNYYDYTISLTQYIDAAFTDLKLPINSFIHKGRCGIGGTTLEIRYPRHSIITVPNNQIIYDKIKDNGKLPYEIFAVEGGVKPETIREELLKKFNTSGRFIKIMSTPNSFNKIIEAAKDIEGFNIFQDCFLLLDECHTFVTEAFRKEILIPFKWFWQFQDKSIISATPYYFTDKRFEAFDHHRIKFIEPYLNEIKVVNATSVPACLNYALTKLEYPGNVHIFYNSVTECIKTIKRAGLAKGNMFFADRSENYEKLAGFENFYQDEPSEKVYKKFNFYTCKYNEGWDLLDDNATIILVTDIYNPHTKVRISNKGIQAIGRSRIPPKEIYHFTNQRNANKVKTQDQISSDYTLNANKILGFYNEMINSNVEPMPGIEEMINKFADIGTDKIATYNDYKFDQMVNDTLTNEEYANMQTIGEQWEKGLYNPIFLKHEERLSKVSVKERRKSKADKLKDIVNEFEQLEIEESTFAFNLGNSHWDDLKLKHSFSYDAYKTLGKDELVKLRFNEKAVKIALIEKSNRSAEMKILKALNHSFQVNMVYTKKEIKIQLQRLYNAFGLKDSQGNCKIATAEQLGDAGRFELQEAKKNINGRLEPAFKILRAQFELKVAA